MSSPSEVGELREKTVRERIDIYKQLRTQLVREVARYRIEGNDRLASIISESLEE
jgi:DNA-binding transcriptional regulator YhcF (GntR family)